MPFQVANDFLISEPLDRLIPAHDKRLETTAVRSLTITLTYKHLIEDASIDFFRASNHPTVAFQQCQGLPHDRERLVLSLPLCIQQAPDNSAGYEARYRLLSWPVAEGRL